MNNILLRVCSLLIFFVPLQLAFQQQSQPFVRPTSTTLFESTTNESNNGRRDFLAKASSAATAAAFGAFLTVAGNPSTANAVQKLDRVASDATWDGIPLSASQSKTADDLFSKLTAATTTNSTSTKK